MGSQRNQIDAIGQIMQREIFANDPALRKKHAAQKVSVSDMCSGSGVASRWFRQHGWSVHSVDQEPYTWFWNYYALNATPTALQEQAIQYRIQHNLPENTDIVAWWNQHIPTLVAPPYFEEHYAPNEHCQRMYFMPAVAHWLDQALHWHVSQDWSTTPLLHAHFVAEVCNAMIRAANTSGTMKSYHSQWGGSTHHRLDDIQTLPCIEPLWVLNGPIGCATVQDAISAETPPTDIVYFDPPASVQQFSSSYHLLNAFVLGHYRIPSSTGHHGEKAGILSGASSSPFSKKATVRRAWQQWVTTVQDKAPWLVVTYPKNGLLPTETIALLLQQHGKNTVNRFEVSDTYVYIVKTNHWQSPQQFKRIFSKSCEAPVLGDYYDPQKLSPRFTLAQVASKINIYDNNQCVAIISRRYKVTWLKPPSATDLLVWRKAELSTSNRFHQYLIERQWLSALTALRDLRRECKRKKEYLEHWNMLHHLAQAHAQTNILSRIQTLDWK